MIIIIDGYNLIKSQEPDRDVGQSERAAFLHKISQYGKRKKHKMVVVFDAGPYEWPFKEKKAGVVVIYSGAKESADLVIKHYIADHIGKELLLVTSDRELNSFASKHEIVSIDSQDFNYLLAEALQIPAEVDHEVEVHIDEDETDLATIMEQASQQVPLKKEDTPRKSPAAGLSKFSKNDRALMKKLKKL